MASLDVNRPNAQEQLATLGTQVEVATLPIVAGPAAGRYRPARAAGGEAAGLRRPDARHRGPAPRRPGADGRDEGGRRHREAAGNPARRRRADRAGRGQRRAELLRPGAADRRRADPHGRRCARRRGAVDARGHRQADQVRRHRREARRARGVPPRAASPAASSAWATSSVLVERAAESIQQEDAERMAREDGQGSVRHERPARASCSRCAGWAGSARWRA